MNSPPALELSGLCKTFGSTVAVAGADLAVEPGTFWGLVGPNGAGKTTLLSMAVGLLRPDAGQSRVLGHSVWDASGSMPAKSLLGVLPDGLALPQRLTGRELLTYLGLLRGLPGDVVAARAAEVLGVLELTGAESTLIADYSTGMVKKIGLAAAVLHGPRVLVLDEPLEAVDPLSAMTITAILKGFTTAGGTVLLSTHTMALVEQLCDHVAVLDKGAVLRRGTVEQVAAGRSLTDAFADLIGATPQTQGLSWFRCGAHRRCRCCWPSWSGWHSPPAPLSWASPTTTGRAQPATSSPRCSPCGWAARSPRPHCPAARARCGRRSSRCCPCRHGGWRGPCCSSGSPTRCSSCSLSPTRHWCRSESAAAWPPP